MTDEEPTARGSRSPDEQSTVVLLVGRSANRQQLKPWLGDRYRVVTTVESLDQADLCLVDERSFAQHREAIDAARSAAQPVFLPVLLVLTRGGVDRLTDEWALVDDVVETPVSQAELQGRLGVLLRARTYSCALERRNERLDRFAGTVTHDLRNPLTIAQGFLESARADGDTATLERVENALDRMEAIINDLLSVARSGTTLNERTLVDLGVAANEAWGGIDDNGATLEIEFEGTSVEGDESRILELFENLFRNAIQHGHNGVTVRVGPMADGFYIEDDGPGIPPDDRDNVFDYGHSSEPDGTGFGLAIVAGIVEAHGWSIEVTESASGGARFEVALTAEPNGSPTDPFGTETG